MTLPRIVIVGGGFAGYFAARRLCRKLPNEAEVVLLNPKDYFLYLPLLTGGVAGGILDPRRVDRVDPGARCPRSAGARVRGGPVEEAGHGRYVDPEGRSARSPTSGAADHRQRQQAAAHPRCREEYAHGFRDIARGAVLAGSPHPVSWSSRTAPTTRRSGTARLTFVVVGAGYTGTEVAAQGALMTGGALPRPPSAGRATTEVAAGSTRPIGCCPGLGESLASRDGATACWRHRGVDIRTRRPSPRRPPTRSG